MSPTSVESKNERAEPHANAAATVHVKRALTDEEADFQRQSLGELGAGLPRSIRHPSELQQSLAEMGGVIADESADSMREGLIDQPTVSARDQGPVQLKDTKGLADQERPLSKTDIEENRRYEKKKAAWNGKSQDTTFNAMGTTLALLAHTLEDARRDLSWRIGFARKTAKGSADFEDSLRFFKAKVWFLRDQVFAVREQLRDAGYDVAKHSPYLEDGVVDALESWEQLVPVMSDVVAWTGTDQLVIDELEGSLTLLVRDVFPNKVPSPRTNQHRGGNDDTNLLVARAISMHLDGAATAAESFLNGNLSHDDRVVVHLREIAKWMPKPGDLEFAQFKSRFDELARLLTKIASERHHAKAKFEAAIELVRKAS